jgi:hypothetical protein
MWWTWTARMREMGYPWPQELSPERAREKVQRAVGKGRLVRPTSCGACGLERELEPYHHDYRRPLSVVWACEEYRARQRSSGTTIVVVTPTVRAVVSPTVWSRGGRIRTGDLRSPRPTR